MKDKEQDEVLRRMLEKVALFQEKMDELQTGLRLPKTMEGLRRAHVEHGLSWHLTYAEALQIFACLSLMMGLLICEDKNAFIGDIDTSRGIESLPMLPKLYEDLLQLMYREQRRVLVDEDN